MRSGTTLTVLFFSLAFSPLVDRPAAAIDIQDTRLLSQPAVSANHIAFVYAEDLWVADLDGRNPRPGRRETTGT